jgi:hypothetical protein
MSPSDERIAHAARILAGDKDFEDFDFFSGGNGGHAKSPIAPEDAKKLQAQIGAAD